MDKTTPVALVTGGANGIGLATARLFAARGYRIAIADRDSAAAREAASSLGQSHIGLGADVTRQEEAESAVAAIMEQTRRIDVLVNAAGWICSAPLYNLLGRPAGRHDLAVWEKTLRSNLTTALVMGSCVVEQMIRQRTRGVIINISSVAARGNAGQSAYAAAKAGCNALAMTWAKELGGFGIRALAIAPGFIDTPSTHSAMSEERLKDWVGKTALRRLGTPPEVARTVIFAVENDYLTGTVIELDGGLKL